MNDILTLIFEFFKTGLFAIGGGLATIPFLKEMSIKYNWFTLDMLSTMIAVSESTPGPIGINMATYVGNLRYGFIGGIIATLSLVAPSVIVICMIAKTIDKFKESKIVNGIFYGIKPSVIGFILSATLPIFILTFINTEIVFGVNSFKYVNIFVFFVLLGVYNKFKINPIVLIILCGFIGVVFRI